MNGSVRYPMNGSLERPMYGCAFRAVIPLKEKRLGSLRRAKPRRLIGGG